MREKSGMDSLLEEERFERKLRSLSRLSPEYKKRKLNAVNYNEKRRAFDHRMTNLSIESRRQFEAEWHKENPDGEYPEI